MQVRSEKEITHWYVLVIAGQSNAQGFGEALPPEADLQMSPRIKQLGRYRGVRPDGAYEDRWNKWLDAGHILDHVQDLRFANLHGNQDLRRSGTVGPGTYIAQRLLPYLPDDAGILLLPQAHGGAGMTVGEPGRYRDPARCDAKTQPGASVGRAVYNYPNIPNVKQDGAMAWAGTSAPLYLDMQQRIRFALEANPANRLLGMVWVQGESDANVGGQHADWHQASFTEMVDRLGASLDDLKTQFVGGNWHQLPWVNVLATHWWNEQNPDHCTVMNGYRTLAQQRPEQMRFLDLRFQENGEPVETNLTHYRDPHGPDYSHQAMPELTDGRTTTPEVIHIHWSSAAYRGTVSQRIAEVLLTSIPA
ncbi:sialate O-acetylesterase [Glaciimonas soli]|uniref:Sialate O-acetylesterase domain-containing protein n=1 Tax=Glaciimonas soli TaxID=2590999 RepID=A0A843YXZ8_9BURK|nr:sialate O-acetylesterase [Glaciimonas soli]MQR02131.1 hypothetical protein [Glaciimonas soli]